MVLVHATYTHTTSTHPQGNTHGKRNSTGYSEGDNSVYSDDGLYRPASPPTSPGSPLTYSPQVAMEPFSKDEFPSAAARTTHPAEFHGPSGWPAQPKLVPTVFSCMVFGWEPCLLHDDNVQRCDSPSRVLYMYAHTSTHTGKHGGNHVELQGSFDNWTQRHIMQRNGHDFMIVKLLPPGVYQVCCGVCAA